MNRISRHFPLNDNERLKEGWRLAFGRIKERIPSAKIVGPSVVSRYRLLKPFLEWSQSQGVFPDMWSPTMNTAIQAVRWGMWKICGTI